ncbi:hypothetical protein EDD85DRAFT_951697 [Armillaria nabsnona]|nr:hypothetical protein EDD85DRAFT_951697 [Armillaria nabsnona]
MSISDVAIPSTSLKKLFNARSLNASLVSSILLAANPRFVCEPAGNSMTPAHQNYLHANPKSPAFDIQNSIPPTSVGIAPSATGKRNTNDVNQ